MMNHTVKIVHLISDDEIDRIVWHLEHRYVGQYSGQQLRDRVTACDELKQALRQLLLKES